MRESFGGAFMIKVVLVFIVVYVSFMAVAINYAKSFSVKNNVINILEQYKYNGNMDNNMKDRLTTYLNSVPYNMSDNSSLETHCKKQKEQNGKDPVFVENGVCIVENPSSKDNLKYFKVITYISIDFPFFNIHMTIPISGETKSIYT